MAEDRDLPGWPKRKLVKDVKAALRRYGIVPTTAHSLMASVWRAAWAWARDVARSYQRFDHVLEKRYRERWSMPYEIAAQYVVLLLAEMRTNRSFKLPYRAKDFMPAHLLTEASTKPLLLAAPEKENPCRVTK